MKNGKRSNFIESNEYNCVEKSEDEIKKYMINENLTELQRIRLILKQGEVLQKSTIYSHIKQYRTSCNASDAAIIFSELMSELKKQSSETQIEAAKSLKEMIARDSESKGAAITEKDKEVIFEMTMYMVKQKQEPVIDAWIEVLDVFLNSAGDFTKYEKPICEDFFKLSQITSMSVHKATSLRILGILIKLKQSKINQEMIEVANLFSSTVEEEIKQRLLTDLLESIFRYLPLDILERQWNDKLLDFLQDSNLKVKCESIGIASRILDRFSEQFKISRIKPLFFDLAASKSPEVKLTLSRYIGPYVLNLKSVIEMSATDVASTLQLLTDYCESSESEIRTNFLYNLPGILSVFGKQFWTPQISKQYYAMLTKDPSEPVRIQAIKIYMQILEFVGRSEARPLFRGHLRSILSNTEESIAPKAEFSQLLPEILKIYSHTPRNNQQQFQAPATRQFYSEILKEIIEVLETQMTCSNWRFIANLINLIPDFHTTFFDPSEIADLFTPVLFQAILKGTAQIRACALSALKSCIDSAKQRTDRETIVLYMSNNFYLARSHTSKRAYIDLAMYLLEKFDGMYMRSNSSSSSSNNNSNNNPSGGFKFINILMYYSDKVSLVRRDLANILLPIYFAISHPLDKEPYNKLIEAFKHLLQDKDVETRELTEKARREISSDDSTFNEKIKSFTFNFPSSKSYQLLPDDDSDFMPKKQMEKPGSSRAIIINQQLLTGKKGTSTTSTLSSQQVSHHRNASGSILSSSASISSMNKYSMPPNPIQRTLMSSQRGSVQQLDNQLQKKQEQPLKSASNNNNNNMASNSTQNLKQYSNATSKQSSIIGIKPANKLMTTPQKPSTLASIKSSNINSKNKSPY